MLSPFDDYPIHASADPILETSLRAWTTRNLSDYTGMLNVETIGGVIIEAHLRFADQWPDLYGAGWVEALVGLYRDRRWSFDDAERCTGFSLALFCPHGRQYKYPPVSVTDAVLAMPGISSVQITFHEDKPPAAHSMPPGGFRVMLVNATDLDRGKAARARLAELFRGAVD